MTEPTSPRPHSAAHYAAIADQYDDLWEHSLRFRSWMVERITQSVELPELGLTLDVGGGTGIYAAELAERRPRHRVVVIDPSAEMLEKVAPRDNVSVLQAGAEETAAAARASVLGDADLVLVKEAVHHFNDIAETLSSLASLLRAGGSILIVMLPKRIDYPLFAAALDRFSSMQPDPASVEQSLLASGLVTSRARHSYDLSMPTSQWLTMVENRFMSLLSTFSDAELEAGLDELRSSLTDDRVSFADSFEFVVGTVPG